MRQRISLRLFGGFELRAGDMTVDVAPSSQRFLAFLALHPRPLPRSFVAATLWPETTDERAAASLRTAVWRLHGPALDVVDAGHGAIALRSEVWVDVRFLAEAAKEHARTGNLPAFDLLDDVRGELLPGTWDDWLVFERERLRQVAIHLFEAACAASLAQGDSHLAVLHALAAVEQDPLRESANVCLIKAHLANANERDARRHYDRYCDLLRSELGSAPPPHLERILPGPLTVR